MMNPRKLIAVLSISAAGFLPPGVTGAVAQPPEANPPVRARELPAADEQAIRQLIRDQETAWNAHDMAAFTGSFRDDAEGVNIVGMYWRGKAAILKHLTYYHATNFKELEEHLEEVRVHPVADGHAIAVSIWKVGAFTAPNGAAVPACRHRSTCVLTREADGWKVVHFHNTTIDEAAVKAEPAPPAR